MDKEKNFNDIDQLEETAENELGKTFDKNTEDVLGGTKKALSELSKKTAKNDERDDIEQEMEELAETFREKFEETQKQAEEGDFSDFMYEDTDEEELTEISEDKLCECCLEKEKMEGSSYCKDCDDGLRHYPFSFLNVIAVLAIVVAAISSIVFLSQKSDVYLKVAAGDKYVRKGQMTSAIVKYSEAANKMVNNSVNYQLVYKKEIDAARKIGNMKDFNELKKNFRQWELNLPHFLSVKKAMIEYDSYRKTADAATSIMYGAAGAGKTSDESTYQDIITKIGDLCVSDIPNETTTTTSASDEKTTETTTEKDITVSKKYSNAMVYFYQYYVASMFKKDIQTQIEFLEKIRSEEPKLVWLYAAPLGQLYAKSGKDTSAITSAIKKANSEDENAGLIDAMALRISKKDYDGSISKCQERLDEIENIKKRNTDTSVDPTGMEYEFYRQMALAYMCAGDYDKAQEKAATAHSIYAYSLPVINTYALASALKGDEEQYNTLSKFLKQNGYEIFDSVKGVHDKTISIESILFEGSYDVI